MHLATLTYQVPADLVPAVGEAVIAVLKGVDPKLDTPQSPASFSVQAKEAAEVTPPASAATNLAGRDSDSSDSAILTAPAIETPAIAARQAGLPQPEDQTPEDRAATISIRPNCKSPHDLTKCAGVGRQHCHACQKAVAESEAA